MGITYSDDQKRVIDSRKKNLLVSAAAGAGKTAVLTERIIQRVMDETDPVDIDRILVVTFTNAAASEMKERIRGKLEEQLLLQPDNHRLQKQATLIHNAQICTIDGFCLNLVKNHFHKIGLDPVFRIANEGEIKLIKQEVMQRVLEEAYESGDQEFINLVDCYCSKKDDTNIEKVIESTYTSAMSYPWPEKWLESCKKDYEISDYKEFRSSELMKGVERLIDANLDEAIKYIENGLALCNAPDGPKKYIVNLENDLFHLKEAKDFSEKGDLIGIQKSLADWTYQRLSTKREECNELFLDRVKSNRDLMKSIVNKLKENYLSVSPEMMYEDHIESGRTVKCLIDLVLKFKDYFDKEKRDKNVIDFSDMSHFAIKILIDDFSDIDNYTVSDVALEYRDYFEEIMIDEYQDSNQVQEIILSSISREGTDRPGNRFMVGDVKQSIYRFRLARPDIFIKHDEKYSDIHNNDSEVIRLMENYRSRQEVVDSVNAVFDTVMHKEIGGVEYNEDERLNAKADYPVSQDSGYKTKLILVETKDSASDDKNLLQLSAIVKEIEDIIKNKKVYDGNNKVLRSASYRDIAILLRSPSGWRESIKKVFSASGIPYYLEGTGTFYDANEIKDVMNLLKTIDNPLNDIALFGTLISFFGKMDDEYCLRIRYEAEESEEYLWDKVRGYSKRHPEDKKIEHFINFINDYREKVTYTSIQDLITEIVTQTGFIHHVSALADGKQREANVEALIKKAADYTKTSFSGIFHFLRYVELVSKVSEEEEAAVFDENADVVRVMSIHKSKGLEFPYCIVANIEKKYNENDINGAFLLDMDMGIGSYCINPQKRTRRKTIKQMLISDKLRKDGRGEEMRVFYVAMTRAREQLILFAAVNDVEKFIAEAHPTEEDKYLSLVKRTISQEANLSFFDIDTVDSECLLLADVKSEIDRKKLKTNLIDNEPDAEIRQLSESIKANMTLDYKYKYLENLYTKTTVSELKMDAMEESQGETQKLFAERERAEYIPSFAGGENEVSGTDRGSAYHKLLQLIDYSKEITDEEWSKQFRTMIEQGLMTEDEQKLVPLGKIFAFAKTELASRMHNAALRGNLYKEQPFVMGIPANRVNSEFPDSETILVQGVIDVYFIENNKIVVMDYKTDRVENKKELCDRYKTQIMLYSEAINSITGIEVGEKLLYSFGLNDTVVVE